VTHVHLATGLAERGGRVLLVASRYENHPQPLWNLPGGRQRPGELLAETAIREIREETGLRARIVELAYVSESYDGETHFINAAFRVEVEGTLQIPQSGDHVSDAAWVPIAELGSRITVAVVREPLIAYLRGILPQRYVGYEEAGVTIRWPRDSGT
jgi:ADP-ribose pyrophosphatase YjhB (NUDIX family)